MSWGDDDKPAARAAPAKAKVGGWGDNDVAVVSQAKALGDARRRVKTAPDRLRAYTKGITLGFADELDAGAAAAETAIGNAFSKLTGGKGSGYGPRQAYDAVMQANREGDNAFAKDHPVQNVALQIAGGLSTPGSAAAGRFVTRSAQTGLRALPGAVARSALVGATAGGLAGAGGAEDGQRLSGAKRGAVTGAVVGAALPVIGETARTGVRALNNATGQRFMGAAAGANSRLRDALRADGVDEQTIAAAIQQRADTGALPPTLADVAGENTRALLRFAGSRPGEARNTMQAYRNETVEGVPDAAINRARSLTPDQRPAGEFQEGLRAARDTAARSEYAAPYAEPVQIGPEMASALRGDTGRSAIRRARAAAAARRDDLQMQELDQILGGDLSSFPPVSAGTLDRIRIAMGERGRTASQRGANDMASGLNARAQDLNAGLDAVPGLRDARSNYRGYSQAIEAVDVGQRLLRDAPDAFAAGLADANPQALQAAQVGARQALADALGQRANASPVLRQIAFAPNARRNLTTLFGEGEAERFIQAARLNLQRAENANFMAPNTGSQTMSKGQDANVFMSFVNAVRNPAQALMERVAAGLTLTDAEAASLVRTGLMSPADAARAIRPRPPSTAAQIGSRGSVAIPNAFVSQTGTNR